MSAEQPEVDGVDAPHTPEARAIARASGLTIDIRYRPDPDWDPWRDGVPEARYVYTDTSGDAVFETHRWSVRQGHRAYPDKDFFMRHRDSRGGMDAWLWGMDGVPHVPYHLPALLRATSAGERVFVVEGEKDVHTLEGLALTATTGPRGGLQWDDSLAVWFRGAHVVIVPDHDPVGHLHAGRVAVSLRHEAASVVITPLPGLEDRGDVTSWLAREGGGREALISLVDQSVRDLDDIAIRRLLDLPTDCPLAGKDPSAILAALRSIGHAWDWGGVLPFPQTRARFSRLGVFVSAGVAAPDAFARLCEAIRLAPEALRPKLNDAFLLERRAFELAVLLAPVLAVDRAAAEGPAVGWDLAVNAIARAPGIRVVRTRWDWDQHDPPLESEVAYLLAPAADRSLRITRLLALPALILDACAVPRTLRELIDLALAAAPDTTEGVVRPRIEAQVAALRGAQLLLPTHPDSLVRLTARADAALIGDASPAAADAGAGALARAACVIADLAGDGSDVLERDIIFSLIGFWLGPARPAFAALIDQAWGPTADDAALADFRALLDAALLPHPGRLPILGLGS